MKSNPNKSWIHIHVVVEMLKIKDKELIKEKRRIYAKERIKNRRSL